MSVRPHHQQHLEQHANKWILDFKGKSGKREQLVFVGEESEARRHEQALRIQTRGRAISLFPSLLEVFPSFLASYRLDHQPKGTERVKDSFKRLLPYFGRYQFQSLTGQLIEQYKRNRIEDGVTPSTINKELTALSTLCRWAKEQGYCEEIKIKRFPNKMTRAPLMDIKSRREIVMLLRAIPRKKRPAFCCMYYLGLRSQEVRDITPASVYWQRGLLSVWGKGNKERLVPINRKAAIYLRNSLPFYAPGDFRQILKWAAKRAGLAPINPHLFRHSFAVHCISSGMGIRPLQLMMGHSNSSTTERYAQVAAETLRKEMEKFR